MQRNMMLFAVVAVVVTFGLAGCGGSDGGDDLNGGGNGGQLDTALLGVWQPYFASASGDQIAPAEAFDWDEGVVCMTIGFADTGVLTVRNYDEQGLADTEAGTWTAQNGAGTLTIDGEETDITYALDGQVLVVTFTEGSSQMTVRWVPVIDVNQHATALTQAWQVTDVKRNGVSGPVGDFFGAPAGTATVVLQMLPGGTLNVMMAEADGDILDGSVAAWATNGELIAITPPSSAALRGVWAADNTSLTFLDEDGSTASFDLSPWAPTDVRNAALVAEWTAQSATVNGAAVDMASFFEWAAGSDRMLLDLWTDGTATVRELSAADEVLYAQLGTWGNDSGVLTLNLDAVMAMDYTISGNTLTVSFTADGEDVVLTWTRSS